MHTVVTAVAGGGAAGGGIVAVLVHFIARRFLRDFDDAIKALRGIEIRLASVDLQLQQALETKAIVARLERKVIALETKFRAQHRDHDDNEAH